MFKSSISRRMSVRSSSVMAVCFFFFLRSIKQFQQLLVKDRQVKLVVGGCLLKFTNCWGLVFFKVSILTMCVSSDAIRWKGSGSADGVNAVLFLMTMLLNLLLYSNFLIFTGDLLVIAFRGGPFFSGEKQIALTISLSVCNWQVAYLDDPELIICVTPWT